jgi:hypothetical protein
MNVISGKIMAPLYVETIAGQEVEIFAPPSPLPSLSDYSIDLKPDDTKISLFMFHGRVESGGSQKESRIIDKNVVATVDDLKQLDEMGIDYIVIGGPAAVPDSLPPLKNSRIILAPPIHPVEFVYTNGIAGLNVTELSNPNLHDDTKAPDNKAIIGNLEEFSPYTITRESYDVSGESPDGCNTHILNRLRNISSGKNLVQFCIDGTMDREEHMSLQVAEVMRMGKLKNFYFEFVDQVDYSDVTGDFPTLSPMRVLNQKIENEIAELEEPTQKELYSLALSRINNDWEEME